MTEIIGAALSRTDGVDKVTGTARYAAEYPVPGLVYAVMVQSEIPSGRIRSVDATQARARPGVLEVLYPGHVPQLPQPRGQVKPPGARALSLLQLDSVVYSGEPVALVIAESLEAAQEAARLVAFEYEASAPRVAWDEGPDGLVKPESMTGEEPDSTRGLDLPEQVPEGVTVVADYTTPYEFHNPMEPHATIARWDADHLTLWDATQYVSGVQESVAHALGMAPEKVHVICRYTGGGFGCKGSAWSHVVLAALAARSVGRPVKLVLDRPQMVGPVGYRPRTRQALVCSADDQGRLVAQRHDVVASTSVIEDWTESSAVVTRMLYACPRQHTRHRLVRLNLGTPTFMRAPGESSGSYALECAMDELAERLGMDPLALRLANYAEKDPDRSLPFSSKSLRECYELGARAFGWHERAPRPRSTRVGDEWVGLGMATATYPARRSKAQARARLATDGTVLVQSGTQDLGTGTYTIMTQIAAQESGFPVQRVRFELGDTDYPRAPVSGGSQSAASVGPAVAAAARQLAGALIEATVKDPHTPFYGMPTAALAVVDGWVVERTRPARRVAASEVAGRLGHPLEVTADADPGAVKERYSLHSFGAVFAEVRVDVSLGVIRVARLTGVYDVGRLLNQKTGVSQLKGGLVWGIGMALEEDGLLDTRYARFVNNNLSEYHVPVNADVPALEVMVLDRPDTVFDELGARGIGEIGITGVAAALANACYHATGRRVRELPITLDKLL